MEITGHETDVQEAWSITFQPHHCNRVTSLVGKGVTSDFHLFGPLKQHLAGKKFAVDADMKQAVTSYIRHLTPVSSMWRSDVYHLLPMYHVHIGSQNKVLAIIVFVALFPETSLHKIILLCHAFGSCTLNSISPLLFFSRKLMYTQ